jgi:hypothetical protein
MSGKRARWGLNRREWQSRCAGRGMGRRMRSVCYAVGIKQCPSSRDAGRRRHRAAVLLPLVRKEKETEWLLETDSPGL